MSPLPLPQEIDAITTQPSSDDAASHSSVPTANPPRPEVTASDQQNQQGTEFEYDTQYSLAGGNCRDWTMDFFGV